MTGAATAVAVGSPGVVCAALPTVEVHCVLDSESSDLRWMVELRMYVCMYVAGLQRLCMYCSCSTVVGCAVSVVAAAIFFP